MTANRITTDDHDAYLRAMGNVIGDGVMHRTNRHLTNHLEQDNRGIKQRYHPMYWFKRDNTAVPFYRLLDRIHTLFGSQSRHKQRLPLLQRRRIRLESAEGPLHAVWALVILALVVVWVPGCGREAVTPVYRIGLGPWVGFGPLYLARDKGFFKEADLSADLIVLTGIAERNSALKSGKLDALAAPVDYFVLSAGNGLVTTIVMAIDESVGGDGIVAKKSILQFADLRGKKVAFQRGLPSEFFLRALLQQHHVNIDEIQTIDMETAQAGAAFLANDLDAAVLWEPWLTKGQEEGNGHILASTRDYRDLIVDCLAFNTDVVKKKPEDVQKIVNAVLKAITFAQEHPETASQIMAPYFQVDPAKYRAILSGVAFADLARNREYFGSSQAPGPIYGVAARASEIWLKAKVISSPVKPESIISPTFVQ